MTFISFFVLFAQILAGGAVAIGIYFGWGNLKVALATLESNQNKARDELKLAQDALIADQNKARDELKLAQDTLEANMKIAQENLKVAQEGQITERFTRAIDQLGNEKIEIRLGGIYALEKIAFENDYYYWSIMEILAAYVRSNSSVEIIGEKDFEDISMDTLSPKFKEARKVPLDIQPILTIFKKDKHSCGYGKTNRLNLSLTNLHNSNLSEAKLSWANLSGANLSEAQLFWADLSGANLSGANLSGAALYGTDLSEANLSRANLSEANFLAADLSVDQLSKVKTLYKAQLDEGLEAELRANGFGHLLDDEPESEQK